MKVTGESISLVELAYGIWLTGQQNHGDECLADHGMAGGEPTGEYRPGLAPLVVDCWPEAD
jgi:hypothetical protein